MPSGLSESRRGEPSAEGEVIELLLVEYNTLRAEITARIAVRFQAVSIVGAAAALFVATGTRTSTALTSVVVAAFIVLATWLWLRIGHLMVNIGAHIAEIEGQINRLARTSYGITFDVLTWESNIQKGGIRAVSRRWSKQRS